MFFLIASVPLSLVPLAPVQGQGPPTDTIVVKSVAKELAAQALIAGDIDYYIFGLVPSEVATIANDPDFTLYTGPSGMNNFGLNPAPSTNTTYNPFEIKEVRFALNYLVDRNYYVTNIYEGYAAPMYCFLSTFDPDYVTVYDIIAKNEFSYDLAVADSIITPALTADGCVKQEGKWYKDGEKVTLKFVIRTEDERRDMGDSLASALEKVGFTVDRQYMQFGQAIPIVYGTDPALLEWHLYTEGWGKGALTKYDATTINQYGAPWYTWMPGFMEEGWWSYLNDTIDELGQKIYNGEFSSKAERDALYRNCTELILEEAVRIFAVATLDIHPARADLMGITEDLGLGLRVHYNQREVYIPGEDTVNLGVLYAWTETTCWNPIGGHDDVYSVDLWRAIHDSSMWNHPFSGLPQPMRCPYTVTTEGPDGNLTVPSDAFIWDNETDSWVDVGPGVTAKSKVVFDKSRYLGTNWHHNITIDWADVLYSMSQMYELVYDPIKSGLETGKSSQLAPVLPLFKGFNIDDENDLFTIYVDYWHFDDNYIADYVTICDPDEPMSHYPWELLAGMDQIVYEDQTYAYSQSASDRLGVPWLSLVLSDHADALNTAVGNLTLTTALQNLLTAQGTTYANATDLSERVAASTSWFTEHDHLVVSDGAYYLDTFSAAGGSAVLKATTDESYPFMEGTWAYGRANAPEITDIGIPTIVPGGVASFVVELSGVPPMGVKYLIKNPLTGELLDIGDAEAITSSKFQISLSQEFTEAMEPGLYELSVGGYSEEVAMVSTAKVFFDVFNVNPLEDAFQDVGTSVSSDLSTVNTNLSEAIARLSSTLTTLMALIGVVAVLVVANIAMGLRKQ
jgi:peptide/nickel transport system substrate-binding protein